MRHSLRALVGVLVLAIGLLAVGSPGSSASGGAVSASGTRTGFFANTPIRHVVILYQENHSFDDVLGAVCRFRRTPCDGHVGPATFRDGVTAKNSQETDLVPVVLHVPNAQIAAIHNRWDKISGCGAPGFACVTHFARAQIPNLNRLADRFVVSDRTFASDPTASFGAHITLAAGTMNGFTGRNPRPPRNGTLGPGWGCNSNRIVGWAATPGGTEQWVKSCVPNAHGQIPNGATTPVPYARTIMQRMEQAGLSWHIYQGRRTDRPVDDLWSVCSYFYWCSRNRFTLAYDSRTADFVQAANAGRLPNLSLMMPLADYSQHNNRLMSVGDNYIGRMVRAVEAGPEWRSTAIFITYDDCGCFYDHVRPPVGLGIRAPMVIVSPYAKADYTDSTQAVLPYSMLAFVQHDFGLKGLTADVSHAYDYRHSFDFSQSPLPGARITQQHIPMKLRRLVSKLPSLEHDPT